jgi:hypothetical protein
MGNMFNSPNFICYKFLIVLLSTLLLSGCGGSGGSSDSNKVSGSLIVSGGSLGDWELVPDLCFSGERNGYFGVFIGSSEFEDRFIRLYREPSGEDRVLIAIPDSCEGSRCRVIEIGSESGCDRFETILQRGNSITNFIWDMHGFIGLDCNLSSGKVRGEFEFSDCH